jgi:hypothetical protein
VPARGRLTSPAAARASAPRRCASLSASLRLAERYTPERLDAACARALGFDLVDVRRLERILVLALEHEGQPVPPADRRVQPFAQRSLHSARICLRPSLRTIARGGSAMSVDPDLVRLLKRLKLGPLVPTLPERLALARAQHLDYVAFLTLLLADEVQQALERHLDQAGFEDRVALDGFDWTSPVQLDRRQLHQQSNDLYELIVERHRRASFCITSNRSVDEWLALFDDPILGNSALARLANAAHQVVIEGPSYRAKLAPKHRVNDNGVVREEVIATH